jgi:hypothetical protein
MAKSKQDDTKATDCDKGPRVPLEAQTIRMADEDWEALERMARADRRATGSNITASGLARRLLRQAIRRADGKVGAPVVIA